MCRVTAGTLDMQAHVLLAALGILAAATLEVDVTTLD